MSKKILITPEMEEEIASRFKAAIHGKRNFGKVQYTEILADDGNKASIRFSPKAWIKMTQLVSGFSTEVEWHGRVRRGAEDGVYEVYDILVFPHEVGAATVVSDQKEYQDWLNNLSDDVFNTVRFHGHSHVNMAPHPSSVDMKYREDVVSQMSADPANDSFYVFFIINKSHTFTAEIYDLAKNAFYSTDDKNITVDVVDDDGVSMANFLAEARKVAVQAKSTYGTGYYGGGYGAYSGGQYTPPPKTDAPKSGSTTFHNYVKEFENMTDEEVYERCCPPCGKKGAK